MNRVNTSVSVFRDTKEIPPLKHGDYVSTSSWGLAYKIVNGNQYTKSRYGVAIRKGEDVRRQTKSKE